MRKVSVFLELFFVLHCLIYTHHRTDAFAQEDEAAYISSFSTLIKDSYSAPLPQDLAATCKHQNQATGATVRVVTASMFSSDLQAFCGTDTICTISAGVTVTMNSNLNLAALVVNGSIVWTDASQPSSDQWLCAGYIAVRSFVDS